MSGSAAPPAGRPPRAALAGAVYSSRRALARLLGQDGIEVVGVLGLATDAAGRVSGHARLDDLAQAAGVPYLDFRRINDPEVVSQVAEWAPDLLFVVGLSQLVGEELLALPRLGCVGFHPTALPRGRGRAPVAWLVLEGGPGAATFFLLDDGVDSGPILVQEPFPVTPDDDAAAVAEKIEEAIDRALERWLPELAAGRWEPRPQDEVAASWRGKRGPQDGLLDWSRPAAELARLVRAAGRPHPGAYCYIKAGKRLARLTVWRARAVELPWRGAVGRVLLIDEDGPVVQTGDGLLQLTETELTRIGLTGSAQTDSGDPERQPRLRVGMRLGLAAQDELASLHRRVTELERRIVAQAESPPGGAGGTTEKEEER